MTGYLTAEALTAPAELPSDDVIVANGKVRVRGLTRGETFAMHAAKQSGGLKTELEWERRMVSIAMLAPEMTEDQVAEWQRRDIAGGDLEAVTARISELSGIVKGADKSSVSAIRDES